MLYCRKRRILETSSCHNSGLVVKRDHRRDIFLLSYRAMLILIIIILLIIILACVASAEIFGNESKKYKSIDVLSLMKNGSLLNLSNRRKEVNDYIKMDMVAIDPYIKKSVLHSLKGGKRFRSSIVLGIADSVRSKRALEIEPGDKSAAEIIQNKLPSMYASLAVEYIHCSSLILDDIHDNDDHRRSMKAVHNAFGNHKAQLSSIYLFGHAVEKLNAATEELSNDNLAEKECSEILKSFSSTIKDLSRGQYNDISAQRNLDHDKITNIISQKTASLFEMSFVLGWICGYGMKVVNNKNVNVSSRRERIDLEKIKLAGQLYGRLYQIKDDFEDAEKDKDENVPNIVNELGRERALNMYNDHVGHFHKILKDLGISPPELIEGINYLNVAVAEYYKQSGKRS